MTNSPVAVVRGELTKVWTVWSTPVTIALVFAVSVGLGVLNGSSTRSAIERGSDLVRPDFEPISSGFVGVQFGQLCLVAFGVLLVGNEYVSGTIRASLTAVPSRGLLYAAKLATGAAIALAVSAVTVVVAFLAAQRALGPHGVRLGDGESVRAVIGAPLYLALMCVLAIGVATMLRGTALSLTVLFALIFVVGPVAASIDGLREVARYLPDQAGSQVMMVGAQADPGMGPWTGLLVLACWAVVAAVGGYAVLRSRDA